MEKIQHTQIRSGEEHEVYLAACELLIDKCNRDLGNKDLSTLLNFAASAIVEYENLMYPEFKIKND